MKCLNHRIISVNIFCVTQSFCCALCMCPLFIFAAQSAKQSIVDCADVQTHVQCGNAPNYESSSSAGTFYRFPCKNQMSDYILL